MNKSNCRSIGVYILFLLTLCVVQKYPASAEVTRLPFFQVDPIFTDTSEALSGAYSWVLFSHTLNQVQATESAHALDTGTIFSVWSTDRFSVSGTVREIFQFRASPDGVFQFWGRALVTDLRLECVYAFPHVLLAAGYRHDCKHDLHRTERDVIHDALFLRSIIPGERSRFLAEIEINTPLIFQEGKEEPDRFRFSAECEFNLCRTETNPFRPYAGARFSAIYRESSDRVMVDSRWNADFLIRTGLNMNLSQGHDSEGGLSLVWALERTSDNWATLAPKVETVSSLSLVLYKGNSSPLYTGPQH